MCLDQYARVIGKKLYLHVDGIHTALLREEIYHTRQKKINVIMIRIYPMKFCFHRSVIRLFINMGVHFNF